MGSRSLQTGEDTTGDENLPKKYLDRDCVLTHLQSRMLLHSNSRYTHFL